MTQDKYQFVRQSNLSERFSPLTTQLSPQP
jgi:hypothetical protein